MLFRSVKPIYNLCRLPKDINKSHKIGYSYGSVWYFKEGLWHKKDQTFSKKKQQPEYSGFMFLNKPKYNAGDTLKLKLFVRNLTISRLAYLNVQIKSNACEIGDKYNWLAQ